MLCFAGREELHQRRAPWWSQVRQLGSSFSLHVYFCVQLPPAGTVEEFAAEKGNLVVRKLADGTTTLTLEDILVSTMLQQGGDAATAGEGQGAAAAVAEGAGQ